MTTSLTISSKGQSWRPRLRRHPRVQGHYSRLRDSGLCLLPGGRRNRNTLPRQNPGTRWPCPRDHRGHRQGQMFVFNYVLSIRFPSLLLIILQYRCIFSLSVLYKITSLLLFKYGYVMFFLWFTKLERSTLIWIWQI